MASIIKVDKIQSDTGVVSYDSGNVIINRIVTGTANTSKYDIYTNTGGGLYAYSNTSNVASGDTEGAAAAHFGKLDSVGDVVVFVGADQGAGSIIGQKCGYIGAVARSEGYYPLVLQPSGSGSVVLGSGQLKFPASQNASSDANTLDDYEEGTFTPAITPASGTPSSYSLQYGDYVKIGRMVHVRILLEQVIMGSSSGQLKVTGLPFATNSTRYHRGMSYDWYNPGGTSFVNTMGLISNGSTEILLYAITAANADGTGRQHVASDVSTSGLWVWFNFSYQV